MRHGSLAIASLFLVAPEVLHAGNVVAKLENHALRILATDAVSFRIDQSGLPTDSLRVAPLPGSTTTVNGTAGESVFAGITKDVRIETGAPCSIEVLFAFLPRDLRIESKLGGTLLIDHVTVARDLRIDSEDAGVDLDLRVTAIHDDLDIAIDEGASICTIEQIHVDDDARIRLGKPAPGHENILDLNGGVYEDRLDVEGSSGNDLLRADTLPMIVIGATEWDAGKGDNSIELGGLTVLGEAKFSAAGGVDFFSVFACVFDAAVRTELGDGENTAFVADSEFDGDLTIRGGDQIDSFTVFESTTIGDDLSLSLYDSVDTLELADLEIVDDLRVKTGKGLDELSNTNVVVGGDQDFQ